MARDSKSPDERRTAARDRLWPNSRIAIWTTEDKENSGYTRMPRLIPLIMKMIGDVCGKGGNPAMAYLELWCRERGQGLVTITDESECAYGAGYDSNRAHRTWKEHMQKLVDLGFIKAKKERLNDFAQVLLLNPLAVCVRLREQGKITDETWWNTFNTHAESIGAKLPASSVLDFEEVSNKASGT